MAIYRHCWTPPYQDRGPGRAPTHPSATLRAWQDWFRAGRGELARRRFRLPPTVGILAPRAFVERVIR